MGKFCEEKWMLVFFLRSGEESFFGSYDEWELETKSSLISYTRTCKHATNTDTRFCRNIQIIWKKNDTFVPRFFSFNNDFDFERLTGIVFTSN